MRLYMYVVPGHKEIHLVDADSMREYGPTAPTTQLGDIPWPTKGDGWSVRTLTALGRKHGCCFVRVREYSDTRNGLTSLTEWFI